ncbi:alpha/beta hydrolase [Massilia sp. HP4]|uniref:RBBP9/YdeN family alpha/beta hydrolase n=1 Tax=Massilia sp. HP4 TaxID=2562316 RepID=UPI0010C0B571|nr:alpha/beta hydrolase [Massilia sp. HP4]
MKCDVLILPGLWNSGPRHWQSLWHERNPHWRRAEHRDWSNPHCDEWVAELNAAIADCQGAPILVAHSLGCMLVAHWALSGSPLKVAGAFLVAPSDVEASTYPADLNCWAPIPLKTLPFPSLVVGSANDPFASRDRTAAFAAAWGSRLVEIGDAGHLNTDSGHGDWPDGLRLLEQFCDEISAP